MLAALAPAIAAGPAGVFARPQQPWASADGEVRLLRPITAVPTTSGAALGSLMTSGWRLVWDGSPGAPGRVVVRLALRVAPQPPQVAATEVLQVGVSRAPAVVRGCLTDGLRGGDAVRQPDRVINGRRFAVWTNSDAGMSQSVTATDLRTVAHGACYAVERFAYGVSASDPDATVTLPQARGAAQLDAALASLRLGPAPPDRITPAPAAPPEPKQGRRRAFP